MAGGASEFDSDEEISGINVTPLVDVVLVLLIIFLITAPAIYQSAIKVQLPRARSAEESEKSALNFTLTREGQLLWGKDPTDWDTLGKRLAASPPAADQSVIISADEATPHGTVIKLMDTLRQAGLTRFALNVDSSAPRR